MTLTCITCVKFVVLIQSYTLSFPIVDAFQLFLVLLFVNVVSETSCVSDCIQTVLYIINLVNGIATFWSEYLYKCGGKWTSYFSVYIHYYISTFYYFFSRI